MYAHPQTAVALFWGIAADGWTAIFTFGLIVVGVITAIVLVVQSFLILRQVNLSRNEFNATHFPRIAVRRLQLRWSDGQKGINFVVANIGDGPAQHIRGNLNIRVTPSTNRNEIEQESLPPYGHELIDLSAQIGKPSLHARQRAFVFLDLTNRISQEAMERINAGTDVLFFFGFVDYVDATGVRRDTGFFRTYNQMYKNFYAKKDDPDFEWD